MSCTDNESDIHCLRECEIARQVWISLGFDQDPNFWNESASQWITRFASSDRAHLFLAALWWLWKHRNWVVFYDTHPDNDWLMRRIRCSREEFVSLLGSCIRSHKPDIHVCRERPNEGFVKLNVDGSCIGNPGDVGFGGLIRDANGTWLMGFLGYAGLGSNLLGELQAIRVGLTLAWDRGYMNLVCHSDSMDAIKLVREGVTLFHEFSAIVMDIREKMVGPWEVELLHSFRETNFCADFLAKNAAKSRNLMCVWEEPPAGIGSLLLADAMGIMYSTG